MRLFTLISVFLILSGPCFCQHLSKEAFALDEKYKLSDILSSKYTAAKEAPKEFEIILGQTYILPAGESVYTFKLPLKDNEQFYYYSKTFPLSLVFSTAGENAKYSLKLLPAKGSAVVIEVQGTSTQRSIMSETDVLLKKTVTFTKERHKKYWNYFYIYAEIDVSPTPAYERAQKRKVLIGELLLEAEDSFDKVMRNPQPKTGLI